jgi:hypothetical protein
MTSLFRKALGYYQVLGGAFGVMVTLMSLKQLETADPLVIGIFVGAILLYAYSMLCGVLLLRVPALALSLRLSAANQLIQMLVISSKSFTYKFFSGLAIIVHVKTVPQLAVGFKAGLSTFLFNWGFANVEVFYGLNVVALTLLVMTIHAMKGNSESGRTESDQ